MSLRPQPAQWFEMIVIRDDLSAALDLLSRSARVELQSQGEVHAPLLTPESRELLAAGAIAAEDLAALDRANEFLLRLRNELHFHAGRAVDVLCRGEQLRIAKTFGYQAAAGVLPVTGNTMSVFTAGSATATGSGISVRYRAVPPG